MKYVRFKSDKHPKGSYGLLEGGSVKVMKGDVLSGEMRGTGEILPLESVGEFLAPVDPPNVIAIGANYIDHCKECDKAPPKYPLMFVKTTNSVTAHGRDILLPRQNPDEVDYEAELAVIIGKTASYVSEMDAMEYVLGYTCANDVSARDVQLRIDSQWARGKSFDTFCPLGPCLVTGIKDPKDLRVRLRLNGKLMQDQPVSDMIFSIPRIISHLSAGLTLLPGTVILTGTPSGVGMAQNPKRFLRHGDIVEVEIDQIGVLRNRVVKE